MQELHSLKVDKLNRQAGDFYKSGQYDEAIKTWLEALELIPDSKDEYYETRRILVSIGDTYFVQEKYAEACEYFYKIHGDQSFEEASFYVIYRLGECYFELGDVENAKKYLLRAYTLGGKDIFDPEDGIDDGEKYYDFLKANYVDIE